MISFFFLGRIGGQKERERRVVQIKKSQHREKKEENRSTTRPSRRDPRDAAGNERTLRSRRYPAKAKRTDAWKRVRVFSRMHYYIRDVLVLLTRMNSFHPLSLSLSLSLTKQQKKKLTSVILYKNELFNRDVRIALYPFPLRVDRYRRRDWLWRRHDVDGSLGGGKERHRRALRQGDVLGGVETSFGRARERLRGGGRTPIISSLM